METTKEQAYNKISQLVERFGEHIEEYKRGSYNEHQTRVENLLKAKHQNRQKRLRFATLPAVQVLFLLEHTSTCSTGI